MYSTSLDPVSTRDRYRINPWVRVKLKFSRSTMEEGDPVRRHSKGHILPEPCKNHEAIRLEPLDARAGGAQRADVELKHENQNEGGNTTGGSERPAISPYPISSAMAASAAEPLERRATQQDESVPVTLLSASSPSSLSPSPRYSR